MRKIIKSFLRTNRVRHYLTYIKSSKTNYFKNIEKNKRKIVIALAADYSNLGDVAITYAQEKILKESFPQFQIVAVPISRTFTLMKELKKICTPQDIITIVGGGNHGNLYDSTEYARQFVIQQFPNNKIVSFPQTMDFTEGRKGKSALNKAIKVYSNHPDLTLMAREEKTLQNYKEKFKKNDVLLYPDIVLSLDRSGDKMERNGIILSLRSDKEKAIEQEKQKEIVELLKLKYGEISFYDTDIKMQPLDLEKGYAELEKIWDAFRKSKVVITDRLHGMIFCVITKTPCVAINNSNRKVSNVYDRWLKEANYIRMIEKNTVEEITKGVEELSAISDESVKSIDFTDQFDNLIQNLNIL